MHLDRDDLGARSVIDGRRINVLKVIKKKPQQFLVVYHQVDDYSLAGCGPIFALEGEKGPSGPVCPDRCMRLIFQMVTACLRPHLRS